MQGTDAVPPGRTAPEAIRTTSEIPRLLCIDLVDPALAEYFGVSTGSGVLFDSSVRVATGLTQGCVPLGSIHQVTQACDNVVQRLDDRPAMDVFVEELAAEGIDDPSQLSGSLHVGLPVS
jgi:hypothetical protein